MLTVADELAFDALDEETRTLCEKMIDLKVGDETDESVEAMRAVLKEDMDDELSLVAEDRDDAWTVVRSLEAQLTHFGITPNRLFAVMPTAERPERPKLNPLDLAEKPRD